MSQSGTSRLELLVQALTARLELLERDNRDLQARVAKLESEGYVLVRGEQGSPSSSRPAGDDLPYSSSTTSPARTSAAASGSTSAPPTGSSATPSDSFRQQVADEIGAYFLRCLSGNNRGASGREKVNLANRVYVIVRDSTGVVYNPVCVQSAWKDTQPLVTVGPGPGKQFGDSIFVGFPTKWEAKRAVAAAGLKWPADGC